MTAKKKYGWGGARPGAGRKPGPGLRHVAHRARERHSSSHPVHITMRAHEQVPPLIDPKLATVIVDSLTKASTATFRVLQFRIEADFLHLVVEASSATWLQRGMQGLGIRIARQVNGVVGRSGQFWGDRYKAQALKTPREVRDAFGTLLLEGKRPAAVSSAWWFDGWSPKSTAKVQTARKGLDWLLRLPDSEEARPTPIAPPKTALAKSGWRPEGLLRLEDGKR